MPRKHEYHTSFKVNKQRQRRYDRPRAINEISDYSSNECSDDNEQQHQQINNDDYTEQYLLVNKLDTSNLNYIDDEYDNLTETHDPDVHLDHSKPLYQQSTITVKAAVKLLSDFYTNANLDKQNVIQLLKTIKSILPQPNIMPTTWKGVLKVLGKTCLSRTTFLCSTCHQQCIKTKYGIKKCKNNNCFLYTKTLKSNEIVEIVNFDIRSQIQSIMRRNISVLSHQELFPESDICYGSRYQQISLQRRNPITIILHSDGAPLIKTSKQSL
ncbi:unnamed protein product, partial [Rotaria sp. Silwood2]